MNSRVLIVLLPLVILLMYPIIKPLYANTSRQDNIIFINSDIESDDIIIRVGKDYRSMITEKSGNIIFDLDRIMGGSEGKAFNTNARFIVGSFDNPVFTVTNNSVQSIVIHVVDFENPGTIVLKPTGDSTVAPGETSYYYFEVNTQNAAPGQISAKLQIR